MTLSKATPRCSATSWAVVVSMPWPCEPEPEVHVDAAVGLDPDVRRLGAVRTHRALRLDVQADADAEQAPGGELLALPTRGTPS